MQIIFTINVKYNSALTQHTVARKDKLLTNEWPSKGDKVLFISVPFIAFQNL